MTQRDGVAPRMGAHSDKRLSGNVALYLLRYGLLGSLASLLPTVVVQNFLIGRGAGNEALGLLGMFTSIANALAIAAFAGVADRFRRFGSYKIALALAALGFALNAGALLGVILFMRESGFTAVFRVFVLASTAQAVVCSLSAVLEMTSILRVTFGRASIGKLMSISGIIAGALSLICGLAVRAVVNAYPLEGALVRLCVACMAGTVAVSLLTLLFVNLGGAEPERNAHARLPHAAIFEIARMGEFRSLIAPNVLRALQFSGVYFFNAIALARFADSTWIMASVAVCLPAAAICGGLLMTLAQRRLGAGRIYFVGCAISCAGVLLLALAGSESLFIAAYFITFLGQTLIDYGFPMGLYDMVPEGRVGQFSAVRSLLYTVAVALFTGVGGPFLGAFGPSALYAVTACALLGSGALFVRAHAKHDKVGHGETVR